MRKGYSKVNATNKALVLPSPRKREVRDNLVSFSCDQLCGNKGSPNISVMAMLHIFVLSQGSEDESTVCSS